MFCSMAAIASHPIWFSTSQGAFRLSSDAGIVTQVSDATDIADISADGADGLWLLAGQRLLHVGSATGAPISWNVATWGQTAAKHVRANPYDGSVWLADEIRLTHIDMNGRAVKSFWAQGRIEDFQVSPDETVWVLSNRQLLHYSGIGELISSTWVKFDAGASAIHFALDAVRSKVWLWTDSELVEYDVRVDQLSPRTVIDFRNRSLSLDPRTGVIWALADDQLVKFVGEASHTAQDLSSLGLTKSRALTYDAANDSLWVAHEHGVSRIRLSPSLHFDAAVIGVQPEHLSASPFAVRPSIASPSSGYALPSVRAVRQIRIALDASCYDVSCDLPEDWFMRYRMDAHAGAASLGDKFSIDSTSRIASYTSATALDLRSNFTAHATDPFGHVSNDLLGDAAKARVQATVATVVLPTVAITAPVSGATVGGPASVVLSANATTTATGAKIVKVDFLSGTTNFGTATVVPFSVTWKNVPIGAYTLTAKATDSLGGTNTSTAVHLTVATNKPPTVTITVPKTNTTYQAGSAIALTATASDADGSISKVDFYRGGTTLLGTVSTAPYTYSWTSVAAGSYAVTAKATDNVGATTTSTAITIVVNKPPMVSLTAPANGAVLAAPATIAFAATASDSDGTIAKVDFLNGAAVVHSSTTSPYSYGWANVAAGVYTVAARATDNLGGVTTSTAVKVTVDQPPVVSMTVTPNAGGLIAPGSIALAATASDADGTVSKVDFYSGTSLLGTVTAAPYTLAWSNVAAGTYTLTAKATDNLGIATTSSSVKVVVAANQLPTVSVTSPVAGSAVSIRAPMVLTATAADADGIVSKVDFYRDGSTLIGSATTAPWTATWTTPTVGTHTFTAIATDNKGSAKTSGSVSATLVDGTAPTVTLNSPANGAVLFAPAQVWLSAEVVDPDGDAATVDFYQGTKKIYSVSSTGNTTFEGYAPSMLAKGTYPISAVATDSKGLKGTSATSTVAVKSPPPQIAWQNSSPAARYSPGAAITLSTRVSMVDTTAVGVQYFDGTTLIGNAVNAGQFADVGLVWNYTWKGAPTGNHAITAQLTDSVGTVVSTGPLSFEVMTDACTSLDTARNSVVQSKSMATIQSVGSTTAVKASRLPLPLTFEVNRGQASSDVKFQAVGRDYHLQFSETGIAMRTAKRSTNVRVKALSATEASAPSAIRMSFLGGNSKAPTLGENPVAERSNYIIGPDRRKWLTGIPHYSKVRSSGVYRGVDVVYYGTAGQLEYDVVVAPGASVQQVRLGFEGAASLLLDGGTGDLLVSGADSDVRKHKPIAYQVISGVRRDVEAGYIVRGSEVGFSIGDYDKRYPLVIDPVISYSTQLHLSTGSGDMIRGIAVDYSGNVYLTGNTSVVDLPLTAPLQGGLGSAQSLAYVTKLDSTGTQILFSTYLGGSAHDSGNKIAVDGNGNIYVTGSTTSGDFPITSGAFQTALGSTTGPDVFVAKLTAKGDALVYATYVGGAGIDQPVGLAIGTDGSAYVAGNTQSVNFPIVSGALQSHPGSTAPTDFSAFAFKLNSTGTALVYSTYLGGLGDDRAAGSALDANGSLYIAGTANSPNFPVTAGTFQTVRGGLSDAFVSKLNPTGTALIYSTLLGGSVSSNSTSSHGSETAVDIAVDRVGSVVIVGSTDATDFPVLNAYQSQSTQGTTQNYTAQTSTTNASPFITRLDPTGAKVLFSTYFGGVPCPGDSCAYSRVGSWPYGIALDYGGNVDVLVSSTDYGSFPTINPIPSTSSTTGLFLGSFTFSGQLLYSTGLPIASGNDSNAVIAVGAGGDAYLAGGGAVSVTSGACNIDGPTDSFLMRIASGSSQVSLSADLNPAPLGGALNLSAKLQGMVNPSGVVTFYDGTLLLGSAPIASGNANFATTALALGSHDLTAVYGGDSYNTATRSTILKQSIEAVASTTVSVDSICGSNACGSPQNYQSGMLGAQVSVSSTSGTTPILGTISLLVDGLPVGQITLPTQGRNIQFSYPLVGAHSISAHYSGYGTYSSSDSPSTALIVLTSGGVPEATLSSPYAGSTFALGSTISMYCYASTTGAGTKISKVEFLVNGASVGTGTATNGASLTSGTYLFKWPSTGAGSYSLSAKVTDGIGDMTVSTPVAVTVSTSPAAPPLIALSSPVDPSTLLAYSPVTLTAHGSAYDGSPLSRIEFYANGSLVDSEIPTVSGNATYLWTVPAPANFIQLVAKAYDGHGQSASSQAVRLTSIDPTPPVIAITAPSNGSTVYRGQVLHLVATATYAVAALTRVDFYANGALVQSVSTAPYTYDWTVGGPDGSLTLKAVAIGQLGVTASASELLTIQSDALTIDSPVAGSYVGNTISVAGTFNSSQANTSVTVNDWPADISGSHFALGNIPISLAGNIISVKLIASDASIIAQKTVAVSSSGGSGITLTATPTVGPAPLTVQPSIISSTGYPISSYQYRLSGQVLPQTDPIIPSAIKFSTPGSYKVTVTATDTAGNTVVGDIYASVQDPADVNRTLLALWQKFTGALGGNDQTSALSYMTAAARAKFGPVFTALGTHLPSILLTFSQPQMLDVQNSYAEYGIKRTVNGSQNIYFLEFVKQPNGIWVIDDL